jgi:hypothetical protein
MNLKCVFCVIKSKIVSTFIKYYIPLFDIFV